MRPDDLRELTRRRPFEPFRIVMTDGRSFDIVHPEMVMVLRSRFVVGVDADPNTGIPDHAEHCSYLHLMRVIDLPAAPTNAGANGDGNPTG